MDIRTFKIGDTWGFSYGKFSQDGFATKDEAMAAGEKYVIDERKAKAKIKKIEIEPKIEKPTLTVNEID